MTVTGDPIIVHPSNHVDPHGRFVLLGFRTRTVDNDGKIADRNVYVYSTAGGEYDKKDTSVIEVGGLKIVPDMRDRTLIDIGRWGKSNVDAFMAGDKQAPMGTYALIRDTIRQYVELRKPGYYGMLSAYVIASYFYKIFNGVPYLDIEGDKQSGKTRTLNVLSHVGFNAIKVRGVTLAALGDSCDSMGCLLLVDQAESLSLEYNRELLGHLADSYTPGGGRRRIVDMTGKRRTLREFDLYGPKVFAHTNSLDSDLLDRCTQIVTARTARELPFPDGSLPVFSDIRDRCYRLFLTKWQDAAAIYATAGDGTSQRIRELWRPLHTMLLLEAVPEQEISLIRGLFLDSMGDTQVQLTDREESLFAAIARLLKIQSPRVLTAAQIAEEMRKDLPATEGALAGMVRNESADKARATWVGERVKRMDLYYQEGARTAKGRPKAYRIEKLREMYLRYGGSSNKYILGDTGVIPLSHNEIIMPPTSCEVSSGDIRVTNQDHPSPAISIKRAKLLKPVSNKQWLRDLKRVYSHIPGGKA